MTTKKPLITAYNHEDVQGQIFLSPDFETLKNHISKLDPQWQKPFEDASKKFILISTLPLIIAVKVSENTDYKNIEKIRVVGAALLATLKDSQVIEVKIAGTEDYELALAEGLALAAYKFDKYLKKKNELYPKTIYLQNSTSEASTELNHIVDATYTSRDLVNEPVLSLNAEGLSAYITEMGKQMGIQTEIFHKGKIEALKMGGLLSVNKGSVDPPTFSIMDYNPEGATNSKPIVLVGKGVMFDTGGLSLKPTAGSMDSMKSDMAGAAAVIGAIKALAANGIKKRVIGLIPATDNRPGFNATTPGDIITMYDGTTVEVLNTDAEGRLILGDALAYAKKYKPQLVIDLATLTGAAVMAVSIYGIVAMGTADDNTFEQVEKAGQNAYERIARLPFWDEYKEMIKSPIADLKNIGGREAGAITAGKFLEHFTDYPWIHLDIAGPSFLDKGDAYRTTGGTGSGARLLYHYIKNA